MADEIVTDAGSTADLSAPETATSPAETSATDTLPFEKPAGEADPATESAEVDEYGELEKLFAEEEKAADPNAPVVPPVDAGQVPEAFKEALGISDWVKEPADVAQAVRAADEIWKVSAGDAHVATLFEGLRGSNPERFNSIIPEAISYIEQITGKKFGGEGAPEVQVDPALKALQDEVKQMRTVEQQRTEQAQQAYVNEQNQKISQSLQSKVSEVAKGTFLEQDANLFQNVLQRLDAMKVSPAKIAADVAKGDFTDIEKAYKAYARETLAQVKAHSANVKSHYQRLRNTAPAAAGSQAGSGKSNNGMPNRADFPEGPDGTRAWTGAMFDAHQSK